LLIEIAVEPLGQLPLAVAATITFWFVRTQARTVVVVVVRWLDDEAATPTQAATSTAAVMRTMTTGVIRNFMARILLRPRPCG
jgi:hypothetical protein